MKAETWEEVQSKSSKKSVKLKKVQHHAIKSDKPATFLNQVKIKHKLPKGACPLGNKSKLSVKKTQSQPIKVTDPSITLTPQNNKPDTKNKPHITTQSSLHVKSKSTQNTGKYVLVKKKKKKKKTKHKKKAQMPKPTATLGTSGSHRTRPPRKRKRYHTWTFLARFNRRPRQETQQRHYAKQPVWVKKFKNCIMASSVHDIINSQFTNNTSKLMPVSQLRAMLSSGGRKPIPNQEWMRSMEKEAIHKYTKMKSDCKQKVQLKDYNVVTDPGMPWLVGLCMWVKDRHTKEKWPLLVKCLYKYPDSTLRQASRHSSFCLSWNEVDYTLRSDHTYYTQIQCLLAITDEVYAELLVHTHKETTIVPVYFDADFWEETENKLETFFTHNVLPYLKDSKKEKKNSKLDITENSEDEANESDSST
ncbi:uncharacterized protein ACMZJ9_006653 [Mantella aurantiaca]